jgi:hypothetical protein
LAKEGKLDEPRPDARVKGFGCDRLQASISFVATVFGIKDVSSPGILTFVVSYAARASQRC